MHRHRRWTESGVSEVVGTILILAMTVVLFATIILWVSSIPTPQASIRTEMDGTLMPIYDGSGNWAGVNVTVIHKGGETLQGFRTNLYFVVNHAGSVSTSILKTRGTEGGEPYGLLDGNDADWDVGERWSYTNFSVQAEDRVTIIVVDTVRSLVVWSEDLQGPEGVRPPLFLEKWADRRPETPTIDIPQTNRAFTIFAKVTDPDGDLKPESVYVYLAFLYGTPEHRAPQRMYDDGTNGDAVARDGIFTAAYPFFKPSSLSWDDGVVLFNATDAAGHKTESRMTLEVVEGPPSTPRRPGDFGSGRPPNLNYNGLQGFNIFNATEWDENGFNATETRTFRESEEVVVVVGSLILKDTFGKNSFLLYDPFSNLPLHPTVYGPDKKVTATSNPSSSQAFEFLMFVNGYNIWIHRFQLNNGSISSSCITPPEDQTSGGICFSKTPSRPPQYYFGTYPLDIEIVDFLGNRFFVSDSINITADDGTIRNFPVLETYKDASFSIRTNTFASTDVMYVQVKMQNVDGAPHSSVVIGNLVISDFLGGTQLFRAPQNGHFVNRPICPVTLPCNTGVDIVTDFTGGGIAAYRFSINLTLADQDPWVEGMQHYSFRLMSIRDSNEEYALVLSAQLVIIAPLYRLDIVAGVGDTSDNAWGTHDISYYWLNGNGVDKWRQERLHQGATKTADYTKAISYLDFDLDGDLDVVASTIGGSPAVTELFLYRQDRDLDGNMLWTRSKLEAPSNVLINDIRTGSLDKDQAPEIVVGGANGHVWYNKNDGSWTRVTIDTTRTDAVNAIDLGDFDGDGDRDVIVARNGGRVTYYPNLDGNGKFTTSETTDRWKAEFEDTTRGSRSGTYADTWTADDVREALTEGIVDLPQVSGSTANSEFNNPNTDGTDADNWTFAGWTGYNPGSATGHKHTTGGNPAHDYSVHMACVKGGQVGGYIQQAFTITVQGVTATFHLDWRVSAFGSTANNVQLYAFIATSSGAPTPGGAGQIWTSGQLTGTTNWGGTPMVNIDVSSRVQQPGTYYLKIGAITTNSNANCGTETVVLLDNAKVFWNRPAGQSSQLIHYYRIQQLPNRPGSTYTFVIEAHRTDNTQNDNFVVGYSTTGQFGTYTNMTFTINTNTDTRYSQVLPAMPGATVWIRAMDTDLAVGNTSLETLRVDEMYIEVFTPGGQVGQDVNLPGDNSNVIALDAGNYDEDTSPGGFPYDDAFVGTANGNVYRLRGSAGGLVLTPNGAFLTGITGIGGIKIGNITTAPGLELAVASNTVVRIFRSDTGALLSTTDPTINGKPITTLSMGDVDGDGDDDLVIGTDGLNNAPANLIYHRNNPGGWVRILINDRIAAKIYDTDLGDMNKSQYVGR